MNYEQFSSILSGGFNAKLLSNALETSEGHLNELRRMPQYEAIAEAVSSAFKLDVKDVATVIKAVADKPNLNAIYNFAIKREINLDALDLKAIAEAKTERNERPVVEVSTKTKLGEIVSIKKIGNSMAYLINDGNGNIEMYSTKDVMDNLITE